MSKVTLTTRVPLAARTAAALARQPGMMTFVLSPVLKVYRLAMPDEIAVGAQGSARFWWFGVIPAWTHHLTIVQLDPTEIYTHEHGGPVRMWRHRLTFEEIDERSCRYTDEIEVEDGWRGSAVGLFIRLMFAHRHRRWRALAEVLDGAGLATAVGDHDAGERPASPRAASS